MNTWAKKIEEFAKPAHKNISILIQDTASEEIEKAIEEIAENAQWRYKEVKEKNEKRMISYQTTEIGQLSLSRFQIVKYILHPTDNGVQLDIESRYLATENKLALLPYFIYFAGVVVFFDVYGKNRENIKFIIDSFRNYFQEKITILKRDSDDHEIDVESKISILSLLLGLVKIYYLVILSIITILGFKLIAMIYLGI